MNCVSCDSEELRVTSAGHNWLVECERCFAWWHISDDELRWSA